MSDKNSENTKLDRRPNKKEKKILTVLIDILELYRGTNNRTEKTKYFRYFNMVFFKIIEDFVYHLSYFLKWLQERVGRTFPPSVLLFLNF